MRLPHDLLESPFFQFSTTEELLAAVGLTPQADEAEEIKTLASRGLPPITSRHTLATMLGVNSGLIWSFVNRPHRYYRTFEIPKGRTTRTITAPRVALKIIQKWLGYHLARVVPVHAHVYGFVPGQSHIAAAYVHREAEWAIAVDIANFFQTTPIALVESALKQIGYNNIAAEMLASLTSYNGALAQGAPSSPALSNICFTETDAKLFELSEEHSCRITRYADDIVFSGKGQVPPSLRDDIHHIFEKTPWKLAPSKERIQPIKGRIKIHGLIVTGQNVRTTKGYRNKLRAYKHILTTRGDHIEKAHTLRGHLRYEQQVEEAVRRMEREASDD